MNNQTPTSTKRITLASIVADILASSPTGISTKETLTRVQEIAKQTELKVNVNYRAVYQQLKAQGNKTSKGIFVSSSSAPETTQETEIAA
jgi:hypothetical protein